MSKESEEKGAAKKAAEIYEKELKTTRELIKECNNEVQQLVYHSYFTWNY